MLNQLIDGLEESLKAVTDGRTRGDKVFMADQANLGPHVGN